MCGVDNWIHVNCALWSSEVRAIKRQNFIFTSSFLLSNTFFFILEYPHDFSSLVLLVIKIMTLQVFEESDGKLMNVEMAVNRGSSLRCDHCRIYNATVGCCDKQCPRSFHFSCGM